MYLWYNLITHFRGLRFRDYLNLFISSFWDTLNHLLSKESLNPKTIFSGLYYLGFEDLIIYVRGSSDDLFNAYFKRENDVFSIFKRLIKPNDIFIDVGANVGLYSLIAGKKGAYVISLEPIESTYNVLRVNLKINNIKRFCTLRKCAHSKKIKQTFIIPREGEYGFAKLIYPPRHIPERVFSSLYVVECMPLHELLKKLKQIKIVKIDVEGCEDQVLLGMGEYIKNIRYIIIEVSNDNRERVFKYLKNKNFFIRKLITQNYYLAINTFK